MRLRAFLLIGLLAAFGLATVFRSGVSGYVRPSERRLEDLVPARIGGATFVPSPENPKVSYRMADVNYAVLDPVGIVARIYGDGAHRFDTVVIVGDHADALHDPRICLPGQDWRIVSQRVVEVQTSRFGKVPFCLLETKAPSSEEVRRVAFTFKGPTEFHTSHPSLWIDFLMSEFRQAKVQTGLFLRVTELQTAKDEGPLLKFAGEAMDACEAVAKL